MAIGIIALKCQNIQYEITKMQGGGRIKEGRREMMLLSPLLIALRQQQRHPIGAYSICLQGFQSVQLDHSAALSSDGTTWRQPQPPHHHHRGCLAHLWKCSLPAHGTESNILNTWGGAGRGLFISFSVALILTESKEVFLKDVFPLNYTCNLWQ